MATTNEILAEIASYTTANGRPCPAKHLTDKFGSDAVPLIQTLKDSGAVRGRRGRNGGLTPVDTASVVTDTSTVADAADDTSVADEFAALAAQLAAADAASAANG